MHSRSPVVPTPVGVAAAALPVLGPVAGDALLACDETRGLVAGYVDT